MDRYEGLARVADSLTDSRVLLREPMSRHTSFRIGGPCDVLVLPNTTEDAIKVWTVCQKESIPCYIIGNGTNLLVRDGGVRGCLIKMAPGLNGVSQNGTSSLYVRSGTLLPRLVQAALDYSLSGLEFAVGIPGSVGGAISMNAGAYDGDFGSLVNRVEAFSLSEGTRWLNREELEFSYRHSLFQTRQDLLVLGVELILTPGDRQGIYRLMRSRAKEREEKQPLDMPSAGSAFRRPAGHYVGYMIEQLGLKGFSCGGAQVSPKHAGFIVNTGNATAKDVLNLMVLIQQKVKEAYSVWLEPEIMVIGDDEPES
jgi:UDP-N-acetylmuramate dehydrogenase